MITLKPCGLFCPFTIVHGLSLHSGCPIEKLHTQKKPTKWRDNGITVNKYYVYGHFQLTKAVWGNLKSATNIFFFEKNPFFMEQQIEFSNYWKPSLLKNKYDIKMTSYVFLKIITKKGCRKIF